MRRLTTRGWNRLRKGFDLPRASKFQDEEEFWAWARQQGGAFQLAAYLIVGMLGGGEWDFEGFDRLHENAHPVRMAWSLDPVRKAMIADFLKHTNDYMR